MPVTSMGRRLTRQITIADDECQPPQALLGKVQETDKLIQMEHIEKGRVGNLVMGCTFMYMVNEKCNLFIYNVNKIALSLE